MEQCKSGGSTLALVMEDDGGVCCHDDLIGIKRALAEVVELNRFDSKAIFKEDKLLFFLTFMKNWVGDFFSVF